MVLCEFRRKNVVIAKLFADITDNYVELSLVFKDGKVQTEYHPRYPDDKTLVECFLFCIFYLIQKNDGYARGVMVSTPLKAIDRLASTLESEVYFQHGSAESMLLALK